MPKDRKIGNAMKRSDEHRKSKRGKEQDKLKRRMATKKAEQGEGGEELKKQRLAKNVPITLDNSRKFDSTSYLTSDPAALRAAAERAAKASKAINGEPDSEDESDRDEMDEDEDEDDDEEMPEAGPSTTRLDTETGNADEDPKEGAEEEEEEEDGEKEVEQPALPPAPPKIMITTSPSPCKLTYQFCDELKNVFPGGQFFKRPRGKGFELGRLARWGIKRGFGAVIVVNEDHKMPNAMTVISLPAGPTAYFRLTSIQMGAEIAGHARSSPHSPELILNNFTTLLGQSVGQVFGALFPPAPQFKGRQVVTLHNQRDFLFFRRHRYVFDSPTKARLQEIGPRFTLKLRWLKKGLPSVTAPDGRIAHGGDAEPTAAESEEMRRAEKAEEDDAMWELGKPSHSQAQGQGQDGPIIPPLDQEQEYEWKWKPKMEVSRRTFFL